MSPAQLELGYRSSSLRSEQVVVEAELALVPGERAAGEALLADIVRWRREHQPGGANAGSVFTNPPGDSAGRLIDAAGLRGRRVGSAHVSREARELHPDRAGRLGRRRRRADGRDRRGGPPPQRRRAAPRDGAGRLRRRRARGTVVTAPVGNRPEVRSAVEPRIVERRRGVETASHRRRTRRRVALAAAVAVIAAAAALAFSPVADLDRVVVTGTSQLDDDEVARIAGLEPGRALLAIDLATARDRLRADPGVAAAAVEREWPGTVRVSIVEERPVAAVARGRRRSRRRGLGSGAARRRRGGRSSPRRTRRCRGPGGGGATRRAGTSGRGAAG